MRSWLLLFLLLLSVLIHDARGRRLISNKRSAPSADGLHSLHQEKVAEMNTSIDEGESKKLSGSFRKLLTMGHISSTTTIDKNDQNGEIKADLKPETLSSTNSKIGREEQYLSVNSSSRTQQEQDAVDMAEMDYTLSRRKPPVHN